GVAALEAALDCFLHPPAVPEHPELLPDGELTALREKLLVKLSVVTRCLPPDARVFRKLALLDEARAAIDPDGGEAALPSLPSPSLRSPSVQTLMSFFGDGVSGPIPSGNATAAPFPAEPDPGRPDPGPNAPPFSPAGKAPAPREGGQKVAVA